MNYKSRLLEAFTTNKLPRIEWTEKSFYNLKEGELVKVENNAIINEKQGKINKDSEKTERAIALVY